MRVFALLVVLAVCPAAAAQKPEPKYEGKPLSHWLDKFQKAETDEERKNSAAIVCAFGPDAAIVVPALVEMLHDHSPVYRSHVVRMLAAVGPAAHRAVPDLITMLEEKRFPRDVCAVLCSIGPDAKAALPAIRKLVLEQISAAKPVHHGIELSSLHQFGPEAAPLLAEVVDRLFTPGQEWENWFDSSITHALTGLQELGAEAKAVAPRLRPLLKSRHGAIRLNAAQALWAIEESPDLAPVLVALIEDESSATSAVRLLGKIGPAAKDALPKLKPLVKGDAPPVTRIAPFGNDPEVRRAEFQGALRDAIERIEAKPKN